MRHQKQKQRGSPGGFQEVYWQVKLPFLNQVFPGDTPALPGTFLSSAALWGCTHGRGQGRGSCDHSGTLDYQKTEEKWLPMETSPLKELFPGPLSQFGSCLRRGETKTMEVALLHLGSGTYPHPSTSRLQLPSGHHSRVVITDSPLPICEGEGSCSWRQGCEWV